MIYLFLPIVLATTCFLNSYSNIYITRDWDLAIKNSDCSDSLRQQFSKIISEKKGKLKKSYLEMLMDGKVNITPDVINVDNLENYVTEICKLKLSSNSLEIIDVVGDDLKCKISSDFILLSDGDKSIRINYQRKDIPVDALVYHRDVIRGDNVGSNVSCQKIKNDGRYIPCPKKEELSFCKIVRPKKTGDMVDLNDCVASNIISRNQSVDVLLVKNGLTLKTTGKALKAAKWGESISVQKSKNIVLNGKAIEEGKVLVQL